MSTLLNIAMTLPADPDTIRRVEAVDPCIRVLDFPSIPFGSREAVSADWLARALAAAPEVDVFYGTPRLPVAVLEAATRASWFQVLSAGVDRLAEEGLLGRQFVITNAT